MSTHQRYLLTICAVIGLFTVTDFVMLLNSDVFLSPRSPSLILNGAVPGFLLIAASWLFSIVSKRVAGKFKTASAEFATALEIAGVVATIQFVAGIVFSLLAYLAADTKRPLMDGAMAAFDKDIGFNWPATVGALNASPLVASVLRFCYQTISWQIGLVCVIFAIARWRDRLYEFAAALIISLCLAILVAMAIPTAGAYAYYHPAADTFSHYTAVGGLSHLTTLDELRGAGRVEFTPTIIVGLVAFPSYHTSLGVLIAYAFRRTILFWPAVTFNGLMIIGTVPEGGHHFADILGGAVIAALTIALVARIGRGLGNIPLATPKPLQVQSLGQNHLRIDVESR